jgi:hypothetical protein
MTARRKYLKRHTSGEVESEIPSEFIGQCPKCKDFRTIFVIHGEIECDRAYATKNGKIYHNCGTSLPCRLFSGNGRKSEAKKPQNQNLRALRRL